jgi:hypothetical protein
MVNDDYIFSDQDIREIGHRTAQRIIDCCRDDELQIYLLSDIITRLDAGEDVYDELVKNIFSDKFIEYLTEEIEKYKKEKD